jgi:hypothetical protein
MVIVFGTVRTLKTVDVSAWYGLKDGFRVLTAVPQLNLLSERPISFATGVLRLKDGSTFE